MQDDKKYAWWFAFSLLGVYLVLIVTIGLGHVEEKTSFGLVTVVNGLLLITEKFGTWLFRTGEPKQTNSAAP